MPLLRLRAKPSPAWAFQRRLTVPERRGMFEHLLRLHGRTFRKTVCAAGAAEMGELRCFFWSLWGRFLDAGWQVQTRRQPLSPCHRAGCLSVLFSRQCLRVGSPGSDALLQAAGHDGSTDEEGACVTPVDTGAHVCDEA
eukprot:3900884-Rhodomonas_salina.1